MDIADTIVADMYDVSVTRSLSEGITGYEVKTSSLYGRVTSFSEGSLYIDVDTDSHSVVSLEGDTNIPKKYMMNTGIISSLYESIVWEQITGYKSISTINILTKAQEEDIDILLISSANLDTEIEKLNTDEVTKQTVINAVNSGKVVTVPAEDVTMGDWHGTGYIVTNPETGAGAYMISGGLNGGSTKFILGLEELLMTVGSAVVLAGLIVALAGALGGLLLVACVALLLAAWFVISYLMWTNYMEYAFNDNLEAKEISEAEMAILMIYTMMLQSVVIPYVPPENKEPEIEGNNEYIPKNKTSLWGKEEYVTKEGLETIKKHLSGDMQEEFNDAMIARLEEAYKNNIKINGADLDFYAHEIYEANMMENGMGYDEAHEAAKIYYNATEFNLYHPEVIKEYPQLFNRAWFEFWGIGGK